MDRWVGGWMDGWIEDRWTDGQLDGWMDG